MGSDRTGLRIGLTGGIGSGKSTVAALLVGRGAALVDTDAIARALTAPGGAALPALLAQFGPDCIDNEDGGLARVWMRSKAFADPAVRLQLEAILHPLIRDATEQLASATPDAACVVFDVPLLVESGRWRDRVDRVLVVDCPEEVQIERVVRRSQWTQDEVRRVMALQAPRRLRRAAADAVIDNRRDTLDELQAAVDVLWRHWIDER